MTLFYYELLFTASCDWFWDIFSRLAYSSPVASVSGLTTSPSGRPPCKRMKSSGKRRNSDKQSGDNLHATGFQFTDDASMDAFCGG